MSSFTTHTIAFKPQERNVFFHILTACNLSCQHCYINKEQHGSETLSKEKIVRWLKIFAHPSKKSNVILLGGEPTLHPDLPFIIRSARSLRYETVTIDTNGFLHHNLLERISPEDAVLSFSLDGPTPEVNDPLRGQGVFDICTTNLQNAVKKGFETSVIYTVNARNIAHLHKMPALLEGFGIDHFFIQIVGLRGHSKQASQETPLQITREAWLSTVPQVAHEAAQRGLHVIFPKVFLDKNEHFECAGNVAENFFLFPNGRVYQCPLCEDHPINSYRIENEALVEEEGLREKDFFGLSIPEGCVMNKLLQGESLEYTPDGRPKNKISCCLLKQEIRPTGSITKISKPIS